MQNQDAPADLLFKLWPWFEANKTKLIGFTAAILIVAAIYSFVSWQHQQTEVAAGDAFTQLMLNPPSANTDQTAGAYQQLAAKYSGTTTASRAQLQAAGIYFEAGRYADAQTQFQKFLDSHSNGTLAATAQLGLAACLEAQNKLDLAYAAYQKVLSAYQDSPGAIMAEFALGRIMEQQGKLTEAENYYEQVARMSGGSLAQEAAGRALAIRAKLPAAKPVSTDSTLSPILK